jgi:cell division protein FtsQ
LASSIPQLAEPVGRSHGGTDAGRRVPTARGVLVVASASAFVLLVALFAVSRSSLFAIRHLQISGAAHRTTSELRARAGVPDGANLVWLDTAAIVRRLEADPWVARATVRRSLPWTLSIRVTERRPIAVLAAGAERTLLAADDTRLGAAAAHARLPVISLPPAAPATVGLPGEDGAVRALAALASRVRQRVREVDVAVGGTLGLVLRGGGTVELGRPVDLGEKARALRRLLAWEHTSGTRLGRISLVAPTAPAATIAG